jgi:hypothetical protein
MNFSSTLDSYSVSEKNEGKQWERREPEEKCLSLSQSKEEDERVRK